MRIFFILCCVLICSCNSNTIYKKPENLIPKDSMVMLLTDMYIASAAKNVRTKFDNKNDSYVPLVYEKYEIDSARFFASNNYYTSQIEVYNDLLKEVKQNIQVKHDSIKRIIDVKDSIKREEKKKAKIEKKKKDSIRKVKERKRKDSLALLKKNKSVKK